MRKSCEITTGSFARVRKKGISFTMMMMMMINWNGIYFRTCFYTVHNSEKSGVQNRNEDGGVFRRRTVNEKINHRRRDVGWIVSFIYINITELQSTTWGNEGQSMMSSLSIQMSTDVRQLTKVSMNLRLDKKKKKNMWRYFNDVVPTQLTDFLSMFISLFCQNG